MLAGKFRGYNLAEKKWLYGGVLVFADGTCTMITEEVGEGAATSPVDPKSIGLMTCMPSAETGKPLYQGDIVSLTGGLKPDAVIEFKAPSFVYKWISTAFVNVRGGSESIFNNSNIIAKVIGNAYENPELLEGK